MTKRSRPRVMIVGARSNYLLRSLPRLFSLAGAEVIVAAPWGSSILSSRYVDRVVDFDSALVGALDTLNELVRQRQPDHLVIVEERLVSEIMGSEQGFFPELRARMAHLEPLPLVRSQFHFWAESHGIRVPDGRMVGSGQDLMSAVELWGDVYMKRDHTSGGSGVWRVHHPDQVASAWRHMPAGEKVLVQRSLHGRVGVCDMVCKHGELMAWTSSEKWRTAQECGPSVARRLCEIEGMQELVEKVGWETGFHGLCGFDWVIDLEDGLPRMIEFHPRPPSGYGIGTWAGVYYENAMAIMLGLMTADRQRPQEASFRGKSVCCYFPDHLLSSVRRRDWGELMRWLPWSKSRSWSMLPWDDPPFLFQVLLRVFDRS